MRRSTSTFSSWLSVVSADESSRLNWLGADGMTVVRAFQL